MVLVFCKSRGFLLRSRILGLVFGNFNLEFRFKESRRSDLKSLVRFWISGGGAGDRRPPDSGPKQRSKTELKNTHKCSSFFWVFS